MPHAAPFTFDESVSGDPFWLCQMALSDGGVTIARSA
jgi:hypothetical protein